MVSGIGERVEALQRQQEARPTPAMRAAVELANPAFSQSSAHVDFSLGSGVAGSIEDHDIGRKYSTGICDGWLQTRKCRFNS